MMKIKHDSWIELRDKKVQISADMNLDSFDSELPCCITFATRQWPSLSSVKSAIPYPTRLISLMI